MILSAPPATCALVTIRPLGVDDEARALAALMLRLLRRLLHLALALALLAEEALEEAAHLGIHVLARPPRA